MPLPVLLPDNTARFKVFYTVDGHQHTQEVRTTPVSPSDFDSELESYYTALAHTINTTVIDDVQFAPSGSNIFNSVTMSMIGTTWGAGTGSVGETPYNFDFVGRTTGGRRMRFFQYGANILGGNYRFTAGENANLDAARAVLVAATGLWLGIDGLKPVFKSYINAGVNAYWQKAVR